MRGEDKAQGHSWLKTLRDQRELQKELRSAYAAKGQIKVRAKQSQSTETQDSPSDQLRWELTSVYCG